MVCSCANLYIYCKPTTQPGFIGEGLKAIQLYSQQNTDRSFIEAFHEQLLHKSSHTVVALWYPEQDPVKKMKGK